MTRRGNLLAVAAAASALSASAPPASLLVSGFQSPTPSSLAGRTRAAAVTQVSRQPHASTAFESTSSTALSAVAPPAAAAAATAPVLSAISALESPLGSVTVLAFVVLIHEMGHFLAARSLGISVREFSVGVGPRLAGFSRKVGKDDEEEEEEAEGATGKKGSTKRRVAAAEGVDDDEEDIMDVIDFNLRAIPLGGYVRFPENYNSTLAIEIEDSNRELRKEQRARLKELKSKGKMGTEGRDAADMVMGASDTPSGFMRFLTFGDTVTGRDAREEEKMRRKAEEKARLAAEEEAARRPRWKSLFRFGGGGGTKKPKEEDDPLKRLPQEIEYYDDPDLLQNRPWFQRALVLSGGVAFNIALAFALYFGELTVGSGLPHPTFDQGALVTQNPRGDGASYSVLRRGDVIIGVNGDPVSRSLSPRASEAQDDISKFISSIRKTEAGDSLKLSVLRPTTDVSSIKDARTMGKVERSPVEVSVSPRPLKNELGETAGPMSIGVMLAPNYQGTDVIKASNPVDAATKAGVAVQEVTSDTARSVLQLPGGLLMGKGAPAGQSVSGPIGVIKAGSDVVSTNDFRAVVGFAAAISINLAVINSLPLPALDGGQLAFVLAEAVTGRRIDQRLQENINAAVVLLLLLVSVGTAIGDVEAIALGR